MDSQKDIALVLLEIPAEGVFQKIKCLEFGLFPLHILLGCMVPRLSKALAENTGALHRMLASQTLTIRNLLDYAISPVSPFPHEVPNILNC